MIEQIALQESKREPEIACLVFTKAQYEDAAESLLGILCSIQIPGCRNSESDLNRDDVTAALSTILKEDKPSNFDEIYQSIAKRCEAENGSPYLLKPLLTRMAILKMC